MSIGFGVGIQRLGSFGVATKAALLALPSPGANIRPTGFVYADSTPENNGIYTWTGSIWSRSRGLLEQIASLTVTGGTANAITATAQDGVDLSQIVVALLVPSLTNTGAVTLNGRAVTDASGTALTSGALAAGKVYLLWDDGTKYRAVFNSFVAISDVAGLSTALAGKADNAGTIAALATKADASTTTAALATKAPLPIVSGVGQFAAIASSSGGALVAPAGGTWQVVYFGYNSTSLVIGAGVQVAIVAGGAVVNAGYAGTTLTGFAWRIA